jgi:hypothetical protein
MRKYADIVDTTVSEFVAMHAESRMVENADEVELGSYRKASGYGDLSTETVRGYLRPDDGPHIRESILSDPVFAVWGSAGA